MLNKPGVPAPGFVKRIGPVIDERRSVEFHPLERSELVNRLTDPRFPFGWTVNPFRGCEFGCRYCGPSRADGITAERPARPRQLLLEW